jgi:hypothetical protein
MEFDRIISLGDACDPMIVSESLKLKRETLPFDWTMSSMKIVYDCLVTDFEHFLKFGEVSPDYPEIPHFYATTSLKNCPKSHINYYGMFFTHYLKWNPVGPEPSLTWLLQKRIDRMKEVLSMEGKKVFIHATAADLSHKIIRSQREMYYDYLKKTVSFFETNYPDLDFCVVNIGVNKKRENEGKILNFNVEVPVNELADRPFHSAENEARIQKFRDKIREVLEGLFL